MDERGRTRKVRFPIAGSLYRCYHVVKEIRHATTVEQWMNGICIKHRYGFDKYIDSLVRKETIERRAQKKV